MLLKPLCNLWDLGIIVRPGVEAGEEVKERLVNTAPVNAHVRSKASTELMDQGTLSNVLCVHSILPTVEDRLPLAICVSHDDEDDPDELPLRQLNPGV